VKEVVVDAVVHGASSEKKTDDEVEIGLEEVYDAEFVQFQNARLFIDHNVDYRGPSLEVKPVETSKRSKAVNNSEDV
jgi:hypothetical protein